MTITPLAGDSTPPRWAEAVLRLLFKPRDRDTVTGDLLEEYREVVVPNVGVGRARLWYLRQTISFMTLAALGQFVLRLARRNGMSRKPLTISIVWTAGAAAALTTLLVLLVESEFGPPGRFTTALPLVVVLGVVAATALRSETDVGFVWRASRRWGVMIAAALVVAWIGTVFNRLVPHLREGIPPQATEGPPEFNYQLLMTLVVVAHVAIFMAAGYRVAYRTGQLRTAVLVAMAASVIGTLVAVTLGAVGTILFFGGFTQALARLSPLAFVFVLLMISTVPGTIGAMFGRGFRGIVGARSVI